MILSPGLILDKEINKMKENVNEGFSVLLLSTK